MWYPRIRLEAAHSIIWATDPNRGGSAVGGGQNRRETFPMLDCPPSLYDSARPSHPPAELWKLGRTILGSEDH